jgi:hypothetical protein
MWGYALRIKIKGPIMNNKFIVLMIVVLMNFTFIFASKLNQRPIVEEIKNLKEEPFLYVYKFNGGLGSTKEIETLILSIKPNGEINDKENKRTFIVSKGKMTKIFDNIESYGFFDDNKFKRREQFGPDSSFIVIVAKYKGKERRIASWHPIYENNKIVASENGLISLDGKAKEEIIKGWTKDYQEYRKLWDNMFELINKIKNKSI